MRSLELWNALSRRLCTVELSELPEPSQLYIIFRRSEVRSKLPFYPRLRVLLVLDPPSPARLIFHFPTRDASRRDPSLDS